MSTPADAGLVPPRRRHALSAQSLQQFPAWWCRWCAACRVGVSLLPEELLGGVIAAGGLVVLQVQPPLAPVVYSAAYLPRDDLPVLPELAQCAREAAGLPQAWRGAAAVDWAGGKVGAREGLSGDWGQWQAPEAI